MTWEIIAIVCGSGLFGVALWLASKNGSKAAQLEALKLELKKQAEEQARENRIISSVDRMDEHTIRQRLCELQNEKQRKRM